MEQYIKFTSRVEFNESDYKMHEVRFMKADPSKQIPVEIRTSSITYKGGNLYICWPRTISQGLFESTQKSSTENSLKEKDYNFQYIFNDTSKEAVYCKEYIEKLQNWINKNIMEISSENNLRGKDLKPAMQNGKITLEKIKPLFNSSKSGGDQDLSWFRIKKEYRKNNGASNSNSSQPKITEIIGKKRNGAIIEVERSKEDIERTKAIYYPVSHIKSTFWGGHGDVGWFVSVQNNLIILQYESIKQPSTADLLSGRILNIEIEDEEVEENQINNEQKPAIELPKEDSLQKTPETSESE